MSNGARNAAKADLQAQLAHVDAVVAAARARLPGGTSAMVIKEEVQKGIDEVTPRGVDGLGLAAKRA
jgi:hypothetical protein